MNGYDDPELVRINLGVEMEHPALRNRHFVELPRNHFTQISEHQKLLIGVNRNDETQAAFKQPF
jgi:hypothetical protein